MSVNSQALAPRTTIMMRRDPKVISCTTLQKCAQRIIDGADEEGYFEDYFTIGGVDFEIKCRLHFSPFRQDNNAITGVTFDHAYAETYDSNGFCLDNDFTDAELETYIKS